MRVTVRSVEAGTVGSLETSKPHLVLATDSQEVEFIKDYFGNRPAIRGFDGFLVNVEDGEYTEVYGFEGNIANTYKPVYKITRTFSASTKKYSASKKPKSKSKSKSRKSATASVGRIR